MAVRFFPAETIPPRLSLRPVSSLAAIQFRISGLFRFDLSRSGRQVAGILGLLFAVGGPTLFAAEPARPKAATLPDTTDISFRNELQHAIDKGLAWLEKNQDTNGFWSTADQPAFTALALTAFQGEPTGRYRRIETPGLKKGYAFLLRNLKPDGGIYHTNLVTYNTSLAMMALLAAQRPEYDAPLRQARQFLIGLQKDFGEPGKLDTPFDGGIGYGSRYKHSDMGNTLAALEALHYSQHLAADTKLGHQIG